MADPGVKVGVFFFPYKYLSMFLLIFETTSSAIATRVSRTIETETRYLNTTAVVMSEVFKVVVSILLLYIERKESPAKTASHIYESIFVNYWDFLKLGVPAALFTLQNNLRFVALSNLDAATYQITYQLKILTTAVFSVVMLSKVIDSSKWVALVILTVGVILVQLPSGEITFRPKGDPFTGMVAVLTACVLSGFAGVYFEKILKTSSGSLWLRNIQLGLFGSVLGVIGVYMNDFALVQEKGFFQGYDGLTWTVVILQGVGGLIIAAVIKYADNILKSFASALSIILSAIVSGVFFHDFILSLNFVVGAVFVIGSTFLYSAPPKPAPSPLKGLNLVYSFFILISYQPNNGFITRFLH